MADQPFDVRRAIEQSSSKSTLQELAKKGIHRVKVLDEKMIHKLIGESVQRILSTKTNLVSDADREKLIAESRKELDRLMKEFKETKDQAELMTKDKNSLVREVENLQEQVKQQRKLSEETAKQRYEDGKNLMREEINDIKKRAEGAEDKAEARVRKELTLEFEAKIAKEEANIEKMKADVANSKANMVQDMKKNDDELFKKMSDLFSKAIDGVNKKLGDLRMRSFAGGGGGGGGAGGRMEGDVELRPSAATIESLMSSELDSNLKAMKAEEKTAGKIGSALDRLKAMRGGEEKKKEK